MYDIIGTRTIPLTGRKRFESCAQTATIRTYNIPTVVESTKR